MGKKKEVQSSNPIVHYFQENMGILIALAALCIFLEIMNQRFFTWSNWLTILDNVSKTGFLAIGIMLCIMLGGIDLIAGAGIACSGVLCICCMERWHLPMVVAIIAGLLIGLIAGMANGFIIAYSGIHPFVVTLAMQSILRGVAYLLANAQPVPLYVNEVFPSIGIARVMGVPLPIIYLIILFFIQWLLLNKTKTGRYIYAVGGNETAARFSGINVEKIKILVWTFSGLLCAFAGIVLSAKLKSGQPSTSVGAETDAIASCVLGGTSMYGGTGRTSGMIIGVFIIGVISNGLTLMHLDVNWQYVVKGVIILVAVYSDMVRQRKSQARKE
ncbi:MAG: ABC transporter permease [Lachnospiraceae bacterium]|nr:ABC transporter permease [Lachnospiraceae bacterium]